MIVATPEPARAAKALVEPQTKATWGETKTFPNPCAEDPEHAESAEGE